MAKAKGCVECIIAIGAGSLNEKQRLKLIDDLKALRARAVMKREKEFYTRLAEAITQVETARK